MSSGQFSALGKYHVVLIQPVAGVVDMKIPALYINEGKQPVLVNSLVEYFLAYPNRSLNWMRSNARALGLFYDYCSALAVLHSTHEPVHFHKRILRQFGIALHKGTIDSATHTDDMQLFWPPSSLRNAKTILASLQNFIAWCDSDGLIPVSSDKQVTLPVNETTSLRFLAQASKAKAFMFLSHATTTNTIAENIKRRHDKEIVHLGTDNRGLGEAKTFPSELVTPLLQYGFVKDETSNIPEVREDITAKMITILLMFGGTRVSEPFHLWFNDSIPQIDGTCKVLLRHPSEASTNLLGEESVLRKVYLESRNLLPRNNSRNSKSYKAGWKELKVDNTLSAPVFFLHKAAEKLYREMFIYYLNYRQVLMDSYIQKNGTDHPFLFVKKTDNPGEPYSMAAYTKALKKAYARIGLREGKQIKFGKYEGTSPHGMRHLYGRILSEAGVHVKVIQNGLRQRSVLSQGVYTQPTFNHIANQLEKAKEHIESGTSTLLRQSDIDALEWLNE
ncbi:tyrosine-type recombinase/integrase [Paraglaciecola mesophila]|uniref:Tyrosine-type recombinase/integrase n=1 Tax=Paraglaciecola mesophila TaxID=197222 RepID=A0ABU9SW65_9ALTE